MPDLSISLLGPFQILLDGTPIVGLDLEKSRALLAFLSQESNKLHRREKLAEMFWPDKSEGVARNSLKQAIANLRKSLNDRDSKNPVLLVSRNEIQFNLSSYSWVDSNEFDELLNLSNTHPHKEIETCKACEHWLKQAAHLHRESFLADFYISDSQQFEEWVVAKRENYQRKMSDLLRKLVGIYEGRKEFGEASEVARQLVDLELWNEENHRILMRLLALNGMRSAALKQFRACRLILADEFSIEPSSETQKLFERIKAWDTEFSSKEKTSSTTVESPTSQSEVKEELSLDPSKKKGPISNLYPIGIIAITLALALLWLNNNPAEPIYSVSAFATDDDLPIATNTVVISSVYLSTERNPSTDTPAVIAESPPDSKVCAPGEAFVYFDDFDDGAAQGWPEIEFRTGGFQMGEDPDSPENTVIKMVGPEEYYFLSRRNDFPVNLAWRFRFRIDGVASLILHLNEYEVDDYGRYYYIGIITPGANDASQLSRVLNTAPGQERDIGLKNFSTVSAGTWHFLEISHFEDTIEIWIDGEQYLKYQDPNPPPPSGGVQQGVYQLSKSSTIYTDEMSVCELRAPFEPLN